MLKKYLITLLAVSCFNLPGLTAAANEKDEPPACNRLEAKATGDMLKFSLEADVDGPLNFGDIRCGVRHRKELCAMEMVSFDRTAKVYDYHTAEKIDANRAYFWLAEKNQNAPILAFSSKEAAEKYGIDQGDGTVLDYTALTERLLK